MLCISKLKLQLPDLKTLYANCTIYVMKGKFAFYQAVDPICVIYWVNGKIY